MAKEEKEFNVFERIQKTIGAEIKGIHVSTLSESDFYNIKDDEWVSTPSYDLNRILSGSLHKGIPTRSLVGLVGPEMSMKSSLMAICMADAQKKGFIPVLIDTERGATADFCARWGMDTSKIKVIYAPYIDQIASILAKLLEISRSNNVKKFIVGLDSLGALDTDKYITDALKDDIKADQGVIAKKIKAMLKLFLNFCIETNSIGIVTGHMYSRPGLIPMPDAVGGGKAFKLFPNILISMKRENMKTSDKEVIGNIITATSLKNRMTPPFQQAQVDIHYVDGINPFSGLFEFMYNETGLISKGKSDEGKSSNTFVIASSDEKLGIGEKNAANSIKNHPELLKSLEDWLKVNKRYSQIASIKEQYESGVVQDEDVENDEKKEKKKTKGVKAMIKRK